MNLSHDKMRNSFYHAIIKGRTTEWLRSEAIAMLIGATTYLIFDDSWISKLFANSIEGLDNGFDGSTGRPSFGMPMITAMLTDGNINMPINAAPYVTKNLSEGFYKSKSKIAIEILQELIIALGIEKVKKLISMVLADAHYATREMLSFLQENQISFLMKIPSNRKVVINGVEGPLRKIFRLKKNYKTKEVTGLLDGKKCYFYAIKTIHGNTIYLVSSDQIKSVDAVKVYSIRWKIEIFHRTAKQQLGFKDCQMISIESQRQHALEVMKAYVMAEQYRVNHKIDTVEEVVKIFRDVKLRCNAFSNQPMGEYFECVA